jgi:hypothetical protein
MVLVYTFYAPANLTFKLLSQLQIPALQKYYLGNLNSLLSNIKDSHYTHILGLGDYRKGTKDMRLEQKFHNKHGKHQIVVGGPDYCQPTWDLLLQNGVIKSDLVTQGPCNKSAYTILNFLSANHLPTKFAFVHIPKDYSLSLASQILTNWLSPEFLDYNQVHE